MPNPDTNSSPPGPQRADPGPTPGPKPWRTEGLRSGEPQPPRQRWTTLALWAIGYLVVFGLLTMQDRQSGPQAVSYTEFKAQVKAANVREAFARGSTIEVRKVAAAPGSRAAVRQAATSAAAATSSVRASASR